MSKPVFIAYTVREYTAGRELRSVWSRIGAAFPHKDGEGFEIILDAFPVDGRVKLRKPKPEDVQNEPEQAKAGRDYSALKP